MKFELLVCGATGCRSNHSLKIINGLKKAIKEREKELNEKGLEILIKETGCHGFCEVGPTVIVQPSDIFYCKVKEEDCNKIIDSIVNNYIVEELLFSFNNKKIIHTKDIPFFKNQTRALLFRCGLIEPLNIEEYIKYKGFEGFRKALELKPEEVIEIIKKSKLRGRGGAGFPTGLKWEFLYKSKEKIKYLICNADEGDPGAFMDRAILESDPFAVLEGMLIAAYATNACKGFIYIREEYPLACERIQKAIEILRDYGFLGRKLKEKYNIEFDIEVRKGAGAFVCGEETALMNSIEGKRGQPRLKPPYPAQKGLFGKPTNINNVKTYAFVPLILVNGYEWFLSLGDENSGGTAILCLTGKVKNNGLIEVKMGTPLRYIIYDIGGGIKNDKKLKAVQTGGPSGGCIPSSLIDTPIGYESLKEIGTIMGSGGLICLDEDDSITELVEFFLKFLESESCGQCTPCREGLRQLKLIVERINKGDGKEGDIELLEKIANYVKENSLCGLGQTAPNSLLSAIRYFRSEFDRKIKKMFIYIITDNCKGCHQCALVCPVKAISGNPGEKHMIDQEKCIHCGNCYKVCKFNAILRK